MKRIAAVLFITLLVLCLITGSALAQAYPEPTAGFFVNDFANVLDSETSRYIQGNSEVLQQKTTSQVVVVTIDSLEGAALEEYSLNLLRRWGIGSGDKDNGVLILLSIGDRVSRIEVGYGLEGALPDGKTGRIQDEYMLPWFREGNYSEGIRNGYTAIVKEIYNEYGIEGDLPQAAQPSNQSRPSRELSPLEALLLAAVAIVVLVIDWVFLGGALTRILFYLLISGRRGGGRGGGGYGGGGGFRGGGGSGGGGGSSRGW